MKSQESRSFHGWTKSPSADTSEENFGVVFNKGIKQKKICYVFLFQISGFDELKSYFL